MMVVDTIGLFRDGNITGVRRSSNSNTKSLDQRDIGSDRARSDKVRRSTQGFAGHHRKVGFRLLGQALMLSALIIVSAACKTSDTGTNGTSDGDTESSSAEILTRAIPTDLPTDRDLVTEPTTEPADENTDGSESNPTTPDLFRTDQFDDHVLEKALAERIEAVENGANSAEAWVQLGEFYLAQEIPASAFSAFEKAIELEQGSSARTLYLAAMSQLLLSDNEQAIEFLRNTVDIESYLPAQIRLGLALNDSNQPQEALKVFNDILEDSGANDVALIGTAEALIDIDRVEDAIQILETLQPNAQSNQAYIRFLLLDAYRRLGDIERVKYLSVAGEPGGLQFTDKWMEPVSLRRIGIHHRIQSALQLIGLRQHTVAHKVLDQLRDAYPGDHRPIGLKSLVYLDAGEYDEASELASLALEYEPTYLDAHVVLASALYEKSKTVDSPEKISGLRLAAESSLEILEDAEHSQPQTKAIRAQIAEDEGRSFEAAGLYEEAFALAPAQTERDYVGHLSKAARLYGSLEKWDSAESTLRLLLQHAPEDNRARLMLAIALQELGKADAARVVTEDLDRSLSESDKREMKDDLSRLDRSR